MLSTDLSARLEAWTGNPVVRALALSLILHLFLFLTVELGYRMGVWKFQMFPERWAQSLSARDTRSKDEQKDAASSSSEVPLVFIDVEATQATETPPEEAKYYSSENSIAANPDTEIDSTVPKISGTQDKVPKTTDVPRSEEESQPKPMPLQPAPASIAEAPEPPVESEPNPIQEADTGSKPGEVAIANPTPRKFFPKPAFSNAQQPREVPRPRYRRLADARAGRSGLVGQRMKQDGGVKRYSLDPGLDVKATPFGSYDRVIIDAIQKRWFDLVDERDYARNSKGKVVLSFRLNSDGTVTQVKVLESQVSEILAILCQRAIVDPAPYAPWPSDMRRAVGANHRLVRFTFHYE